MKSRIIPIAMIIILTGCGVKTAVPGFEYPVYSPDAKWPTLAPTAKLQQKTDVDIDAAIKDVERLKRLVK